MAEQIGLLEVRERRGVAGTAGRGPPETGQSQIERPLRDAASPDGGGRADIVGPDLVVRELRGRQGLLEGSNLPRDSANGRRPRSGATAPGPGKAGA